MVQCRSREMRPNAVSIALLVCTHISISLSLEKFLHPLDIERRIICLQEGEEVSLRAKA